MVREVFFESIEIKGYRGRNFELKMNPPGEHSVFEMDGNTGKTTTIELLRWCFKYKQSEAAGKFRHMWTEPAHVLDFMKTGPQVCEIKIAFSDGTKRYFFRRITEGTYIDKTDEKSRIIGDQISDIKDSLEIDAGEDVINGDDVNKFLKEKFRFGQSVDYFCFDGERARDLLIKASDTNNLDYLTSLINERATHPTLKHYDNQLEKLKGEIYSKLKSRAPDRKIGKFVEEAEGKNKEINEARICLQQNNDELSAVKEAIRIKEAEIDELDQERIQRQSQKISEKVGYERQIEEIKQKVLDKRIFIFQNSLNWFSHIDADYLNQLKNYVREVGRLPEPYRKDLIEACLNHNPPICQICGRELNDDASFQHVKNLKKLVASHEVQTFLADKAETDEILFSPKDYYNDLLEQFDLLEDTEQLNNSIVLSDEEDKLMKDLETARKDKEALLEKFHTLEADNDVLSDAIKILEEEKREYEDKLDIFKEYQIILKNIEKTQKTIQAAQEVMKEKTIDIISSVLSESISSILGPAFSADFSREHGLLLGENNRFSPEIGGMSGRIILAYCFAEAMTLIDPIIIDTPSGNVGSHRKRLAEHLSANHKQVICLCLPTEIEDFAPYISPDSILIENKGD